MIEAEELADKLLKQRTFFEGSGGGVTISGGEPLMQPDFLCELLERLRPLHRMIETSGYASDAIFQKVVSLCDMVYMDIKHVEDAVHCRVTGVIWRC